MENVTKPNIWVDLTQYEKIQDFMGIEPYDLAEMKVTLLPRKIFSKISFLNKISPFDLRPFLKIAPTLNTKANALFLLAFINSNFNRYEKTINELVHWFINSKS